MKIFDALISGSIQLPNYPSAPTGATSGSLYFNTGDKQVYQYNGTSWVQIGASVGGAITTGSISTTQAISGSLIVSNSLSITGSFAVTTSGATASFNVGITYVSGGLGVGTATPNTVGLIRATNDVIAFFSSDERLKENKTKISGSLDKLKLINGYEFDWIPANGVHENKGHDIGVIAQEVEKVLPEIVTTRDNGFKAVKYEKLVALLIESNKELLKRIEFLESKIN